MKEQIKVESRTYHPVLWTSPKPFNHCWNHQAPLEDCCATCQSCPMSCSIEPHVVDAGLSSHDGAEQGAVMAFKSPKALARSFAG
eukprot:2148860-Amphidinium_carterae.1